MGTSIDLPTVNKQYEAVRKVCVLMIWIVDLSLVAEHQTNIGLYLTINIRLCLDYAAAATEYRAGAIEKGTHPAYV